MHGLKIGKCHIEKIGTENINENDFY